MKTEMKEKTNIARRLCMYVAFVQQIRFRRGNGKKFDFTVVFRNCLLSRIIANLLRKFLSFLFLIFFILMFDFSLQR